MRYCSKCGKPLEGQERFCANCGASVEPQMAQNNYPQGGSPDNGSKKMITILAVVLGVVVIICATVLVAFSMNNKNDLEETVAVESSSVDPNITDEARYLSLKSRFDDAKLKAAKRNINVKKEIGVAEAALNQYDGAIKDNNTALLAEYAAEAEKDVSALESASNKAKKSKKKVVVKNTVPEYEKINVQLAPDDRIEADKSFPYPERMFNLISDDDNYGALLIAKNEYYARKGCHFKTKSLQDYFNHQKWYVNEGKDPNDNYLTSTERHNVKVLNKEKTHYKYLSRYTGWAKDFSCPEYLDIARECY